MKNLMFLKFKWKNEYIYFILKNIEWWLKIIEFKSENFLIIINNQFIICIQDSYYN
jgi:hypothetical protein